MSPPSAFVTHTARRERLGAGDQGWEHRPGQEVVLGHLRGQRGLGAVGKVRSVVRLAMMRAYLKGWLQRPVVLVP